MNTMENRVAMLNDSIQEKRTKMAALKKNTTNVINRLLNTEMSGLNINLGSSSSTLYFEGDRDHMIELYHGYDIDDRWDFKINIASYGSFSLMDEETKTARYYHAIAKVLTNKVLVNVLDNLLNGYVDIKTTYQKELKMLHKELDDIAVAITEDVME